MTNEKDRVKKIAEQIGIIKGDPRDYCNSCGKPLPRGQGENHNYWGHICGAECR